MSGNWSCRAVYCIIQLMESVIFRAYDIRGVYPSQINEDAAKRIGNAAARFLKAKTVVVGEDGRLSSPRLRQAVVEGANAAGCDAIYIGRCTTPMFYYAVKYFDAGGGIMITASHNPPEYNGLKIMGKGAVPVDTNGGLKIIQELASGEMLTTERRGETDNRPDVLNDYINFLANASGIRPGELNLKTIIDAGNGTGGMVAEPFFDKLKVDYSKLFFDIDGSFPNRAPDPARGKNLEQLSREVIRQKADIGIAFDGDADRLAVVDEKGEFVPSQYILAILWQEGGRAVSGHKVVYDLRFSRVVKDFFGTAGIRSMVGHSYMADKMKIADALIGGETSGHFFFRETNYNESAVLAAGKLLKILQDSGKKLSELAEPFKKGYYSGEINIALNITVREEIIGLLKIKYKNEETDELDGLTVEHWDKAPAGEKWWFNIRPSNTEPAMRLIVEADTEELMKEKTEELRQFLSFKS